MDRAISQDAFGIPGIDQRGVGGLENCVVSYDLLILPCEGMLDVPSLRAKWGTKSRASEISQDFTWTGEKIDK